MSLPAELQSLAVWNGIVIVAILAGGLLPLVHRWSERVLHLFVALAAGVFLGAVFLHLLPELVEARPSAGVTSLVPISIVALFAIERLLLRGPNVDESAAEAGHSSRVSRGPHDVLGHATLFGLAVHSVAGGFGLAVGGATPDLQLAIFLSILGHKTAEAFSLSTVLLLAGQTAGKVAARVGFLALMTPLGCLIGILSLALPAGSPLAPMAIATGTFLYVALMDILPEVLHQRQDLGWKVLLMLAGLAFMAFLRTAHSGHGPHFG